MAPYEPDPGGPAVEPTQETDDGPLLGRLYALLDLLARRTLPLPRPRWPMPTDSPAPLPAMLPLTDSWCRAPPDDR